MTEIKKTESERNSVLIELTKNRAFAKNYTYRWMNKSKGLPSLRNDITSALFRANYVESIETEDGVEMILSPIGQVIVDKFIGKAYTWEEVLQNCKNNQKGI